MEHRPLHRVTAFTIVGPYELDVTFDDGLMQRINFERVLEGQLYGPLKDLNVFNGVKITDDGVTLEWPNGADFDPSELHDWPEVEAHFIAAAREWAVREAERR